jgi:perosamine synthetase
MIRITRPALGEAELAAVQEVLASGYLTQGALVARFEERLAAVTGAPFVVAVSSGTAALHLALMALGVGPGDDVVTSDFTFPATVNVIELVGARPVLVDIDLSTFDVDMARVEAALTPRTKAILPVHEFGLMADMAAIVHVAGRRRVVVVEDAACALGASVRIGDETVGAGRGGAVGCFSFHPRKSITTGEGGCLTTADAAIAAELRALRNHGLAPGPDGLDIARPAPNYRLGEIQAALGCAQLDRLEWALRERRRLAGLYDEALASIPWLRPPHEPKDHVHAYQSYVVMLPEDMRRDAVIARLRERDVETVRGAYAVHRLRFYRERYGHLDRDFPAATAADERALALPLYPGMPDEAVEQVARALGDCGR